MLTRQIIKNKIHTHQRCINKRMCVYIYINDLFYKNKYILYRYHVKFYNQSN